LIADDNGDTDDDGNTTNDGNTNDNNTTDYEVDENKSPTMVKGKKSKAAVTATKKAGAKTTGDNVIQVDTPLSKKAKYCTAARATMYFSTTALKASP
jgi:hypothetical protein